MKFQVQFKDPDVVREAAEDAAKESFPEGLSDEEKEMLVEKRTEKLTDFTGKWIKYGEYVTIEFDTDAGTAVVVPQNNNG